MITSLNNTQSLQPHVYITPSGFAVKSQTGVDRDVAKVVYSNANNGMPNMRLGILRPNDSTNYEIRELYMDLVAGELDTKDPITMRKVLSVYKRHFNNNPIYGFLNMQFNNSYLKGNITEAVKDTIRFIDTGRRHMPYSVLFPLLEASIEDRKLNLANEKPLSKDSFYTNDMKKHLLSIQRQAESFGLIGDVNHRDNMEHVWITKQGGLEDIVCTMYIVFCFNPL